MRPIEHLVASAAFGGGLLAASGSVELAAAAFIGGTLIDLDHYLDYLCFNGRQHPHPLRFLDFYGTHQYTRVVLIFHAWEWVLPSLILIMLHPSPPALGLWLGAMFHFALDLGFNAPRIRRPFLFYSLIYRWLQDFRKDRLLYPEPAPSAHASPRAEA